MHWQRATLNGMPLTSPRPDPQQAATQFCELFPVAYRAFHRRVGKRSRLTAASSAVLTHLAQAGPMTIGEAARHLDRAQSVVSDIVTQLEGHGLLTREPDPQDRRRTLVWLTDDGFSRLRRETEVLDAGLVAESMSRLTPECRQALLLGLADLVRAGSGHRSSHRATHPQSRNEGDDR